MHFVFLKNIAGERFLTILPDELMASENAFILIKIVFSMKIFILEDSKKALKVKLVELVPVFITLLKVVLSIETSFVNFRLFSDCVKSS